MSLKTWWRGRFSWTPVKPLTPEEVAEIKKSVASEKFLRRLPVDLDIAVDEAADGVMNETISSRAARAALKGKTWGIVLCNFLNIFERNHGAKAIAGDEARDEEDLAVEKPIE